MLHMGSMAGRFLRAVAVFAALITLSACAATYTNHGFVPTDEDVEELMVGLDTRETVAAIVGKPGAAGLLTEEEAAISDLKHIITRSVGFERHVEADVTSVSVTPGDAFLLCSDGLSNYVEGEEIAALARDHWYADLPRVCTDLANRRGGDDNITVVVALVCNDTDQRRPPRAKPRSSTDTLPPTGRVIDNAGV